MAKATDATHLFEAGLTPQDMLDFYKENAISYEQHMSDADYKAPKLVADELESHYDTSRDIKLLDCGAGTGLVGEQLVRRGFSQLDAVEPSMDMIAILEKKQIYKRIMCDYLGTNRLPVENDSYDCALLIGVISAGSASEDCFPELIRIVKPGGIIIICTREINILTDLHLKEHVEREMKRLHDDKKWLWLKREIIPNYILNFNGFYAVFKVL